MFDGREGVHAPRAASPARNAKLPRSPARTSAGASPTLLASAAPGETIFENEGVRLWADAGDDIAMVVQDQDARSATSCSTAAGNHRHAERKFAGYGDLAAGRNLLGRCRTSPGALGLRSRRAS